MSSITQNPIDPQAPPTPDGSTWHEQARSDGATWHEQNRDLRRAHLVRAMAVVACEHGFAGASVHAVCRCAKVSARTFYTTFPSREECFLAVLDECHSSACALLLHTLTDVEDWRAGLRVGLAELLLFLDAEPHLARVSVVESLAAGPWALERREQHAASLTGMIVEHWGWLAPPEPHALTHVGVMASVLGTVQNHLARRAPEPLIGLLGPLMGLVTAPYLDAWAVAEEVNRAECYAQGLLAMGVAHSSASDEPHSALERTSRIPALLANPRARRLRQCMLYLAEHPGASNRQVASAIGVTSHTQVSTLLTRLQRAGSLQKHQGSPGHPNAWTLTPEGERVAQALHLTEQPQLLSGALN
jgi:AcrR family transcriptional regulator